MPRPPGAFFNLMEHLFFYLALGGITRPYCKRFCRMEGPWVPRPPGALLCIYFIYFIPQGAQNLGTFATFHLDPRGYSWILPARSVNLSLLLKHMRDP